MVVGITCATSGLAATWATTEGSSSFPTSGSTTLNLVRNNLFARMGSTNMAQDRAIIKQSPAVTRPIKLSSSAV